MLLFACVYIYICLCLQEQTCAVARKGVAVARRKLRDGNVDPNQLTSESDVTNQDERQSESVSEENRLNL